MKPNLRWVHVPLQHMGASTGAKSTGVKERGNVYHRKIYGLLALHVAHNLTGWKLYVEPWFREVGNGGRRVQRSPDAVLVHEDTSTAVVVEVKLNWANGRDRKLIDEYLPIVKSAFQLDCVWPLLITQCLRGYQHKPLLSLRHFDQVMTWQPRDPTPLMLLL